MKTEEQTPPPLIAFYCSSIAWGGLEMNTVRYAGWMQKQGYRVVVFCVGQSPIHKEALSAQLPFEIIVRNRKYFDFLNAYRISRKMRNKHVQLVWFRDTRDMDLLAWAKRIFGLRVPFIYQQAMQFGVRKMDIFHTFRFRCIDAWVSTLPFLAEQVRTMTRFDETKIHVVPLGVPLPTTEMDRSDARNIFNIPNDAYVLGIIGRIDPLKGQHDAVEALRILHRAGKKNHLLMVGDSTLHEGESYRARLLADIQHYQLTDYVHFHGHLRDPQPFYSSIDCFLMCSKGETFGTVTIEAMAQQTPVIATQSGGTPEILAHGACGLLYTPGNAEELAHQIMEMQENTILRENLVQHAAQRYEDEFTTLVSVQRMSQVIKTILRN